jgi:catechol 2,3-dioxygenase-like lactoylglutathione lyase family enzyme
MPTILQNHHVLAVPDKDASAAFFVRMLGFREVFRDSGWVCVKKDDCMLMLGECPDAIHPQDLGDHNYFSYLVVDDADAYFRELGARDVDLIAPIADKPWGMREFGVRTPDGYRLMIGHRLPEPS